MKAMILLLTAALCSAGAYATVPQMINYQGYLTNSGGAPINTPVAITVRLYDAATAGTLKWSEIQPSVEVTDGVFNVVLGSVTPLPPLAFDVP